MLPLRDHLPTRTFPFINYALIAANVGVFLFERFTIEGGVPPDALLHAFGLIPARMWVDPVGAIQTVFTSMFMHDPTNILHVGGNMLFLWIFGDNVEDAMGHGRYLVFYVTGGLCAAAAQVMAGPMSVVPMVGASGAIAAVLAAYAFLYPKAPVTVLNPVFILWLFFGLFLIVPAWLVIGLFFVINLWDALSNDAQGGVAFMAHVGGFLGGAVLLRVFLGDRPRMDDYARWERWTRRRRSRDDY